MRFKVIQKPNKEQSKETAKYLLDISKAIFLATVVGFFIPGFGAKIGVGGFILGLVISFMLYFIAMWLLKEVE